MVLKMHASDRENPELPGPRSAQAEPHPAVLPKGSGIGHLIFTATVAGEFHLDSFFLFRGSSVFILCLENYESDYVYCAEETVPKTYKEPPSLPQSLSVLTSQSFCDPNVYRLICTLPHLPSHPYKNTQTSFHT